MLKKWQKVFLGIPSLSVLILPFSSLSSCNKETPVVEEKSITCPTQTEYTAQITKTGAMYVLMTGFSYTGFLEKNCLDVVCNFPSSIVRFTPTILNWSDSKHTFDVVLSSLGAQEGLYNGRLSFKYGGQVITTYNSQMLQIRLGAYRSIGAPDNISDAQMRDADNSAQFIFTNFSYINMGSIQDNLRVIPHFEQGDASFSADIVNATSKSFDVVVTGNNLDVGKIYGSLSFEYLGEEIVNFPSIEFTLHVLRDAEIITPNTIFYELNGNPLGYTVVTFSGFIYNNINDPENIEVNTNFTKGIKCESSSCQITNINKTFKTFDIKLSFYKTYATNYFPGYFEFIYNSKTILKTSNKFHITINIPMPENFLSYKTLTTGEQVITGINQTIDAEEFKRYNSFSVPTYISGINDSCNWLPKDQTSWTWDWPKIFIPKNIKFIGADAFKSMVFRSSPVIEFELSGAQLERIGSSAFEMYNKVPFAGDLILPSSLQTISARAFYHNSFNSITFPTSLTFVGQSAFYSSMVEVLDFSAYTAVPTTGWDVDAFDISGPGTLYYNKTTKLGDAFLEFIHSHGIDQRYTWEAKAKN